MVVFRRVHLYCPLYRTCMYDLISLSHTPFSIDNVPLFIYRPRIAYTRPNLQYPYRISCASNHIPAPQSISHIHNYDLFLTRYLLNIPGISYLHYKPRSIPKTITMQSICVPYPISHTYTQYPDSYSYPNAYHNNV